MERIDGAPSLKSSERIGLNCGSAGRCDAGLDGLFYVSLRRTVDGDGQDRLRLHGQVDCRMVGFAPS